MPQTSKPVPFWSEFSSGCRSGQEACQAIDFLLCHGDGQAGTHVIDSRGAAAADGVSRSALEFDEALETRAVTGRGPKLLRLDLRPGF